MYEEIWKAYSKLYIFYIYAYLFAVVTNMKKMGYVYGSKSYQYLFSFHVSLVRGL